jgi:hypothetical protein
MAGEVNLLLWQLFRIQESTKLADGVAEMCSGRLAVDLAVQHTHSPLRSLSLFLGESGRRRGRFGGREGYDVCLQSVYRSMAGERACRSNASVKSSYTPSEKGMMDVNGEYGIASSTVGGGR